MPNLSERVRLQCEQILGVPVVKVKQTDDRNVALALTGEGRGTWIDLTTNKKTKAVTINGEKIRLVPEVNLKKWLKVKAKEKAKEKAKPKK